MKYPLEQLDHFIHKNLCPPVLINAINNGSYTHAVWENVLSEDGNIKIHLLEQVARIKKRNRLSIFVDGAHLSSINLFRTVSEYIMQIQSLEATKDHYQHITRNYVQLRTNIYSIIRFIEENFGIYLSSFTQSLCGSSFDSPEELRLRFTELKFKLQLQCNDPTLSNIALSTAEEFFAAPSLNIYNYSYFLYFKKYIHHLEKLVAKNETPDLTQELKHSLLFLNYNKFSFVDYIMHELKGQADKLEGRREKISKWYFYLKEFRQFHHLPRYVLFKESPSLKEMVSHSIRQEILYLEKEERLQSAAQTETNKEQPSTGRFLTSLSVSQLALFIRLLLDTEILQTKNQSDILRKIATSARTMKTETISFESLRTKFYNPEMASINIVKDHLLKMINQLRNY